VFGETSISRRPRRRIGSDNNHETTDRQRSPNSQRLYILIQHGLKTRCALKQSYRTFQTSYVYFGQRSATSASSPVTTPARRHVRESRVPYELCTTRVAANQSIAVWSTFCEHRSIVIKINYCIIGRS